MVQEKNGRDVKLDLSKAAFDHKHDKIPASLGGGQMNEGNKEM